MVDHDQSHHFVLSVSAEVRVFFEIPSQRAADRPHIERLDAQLAPVDTSASACMQVSRSSTVSMLETHCYSVASIWLHR